MPDTLTDQYWRLPPISRTLATWMFVTSLGLHFGFIPFEWLIYNKFYILNFPPQIWRLATGFLITGPELGLLFDTYFFYTAASHMETGHPRMRRKEDFIWYLVCVCSFIAVIDYFVAIQPFYALTRGLIVALTYTATQQQQGLTVTYIVVPIPAPLMPYAMILVSLLFPNGMSDFILGLYGLVAAHLWEFLTRIYPQLGGGPNILKTPKFMTSLVRIVEGRRQLFSTSGVVGGEPDAPASGNSTGASSGPLPDAWRTRGSGQRLG